MAEQTGGAEQADGYDEAAMEVLRGLGPRGPWQLLLVGHDLEAADTGLVAGLTRILELMPSVPSLSVETTRGSFVATRDFASGSLAEVDVILAGLFRRNPELAGIQFPGSETRPAHTATANDPFRSPQGLQSARIKAAMARGDITPQEASDQLDQLYCQN